MLILFFLMWRNMVQIKKATNYIAYGTERRKGKISKLFDLIVSIHNESAEEKKSQAAEARSRKSRKTSRGEFKA